MLIIEKLIKRGGMGMKISIENNRVFVNDKEIKGWRRFLILFLTYLVVPIFILIAFLMALTLVGITLGFIIPICIGIAFMAGIIVLITKLFK